jgi:hypothetical protein
LLLAAAILLAGCDVGGERKDPLELKVRDLEREKAELSGQLEQSHIAIEQLQAQMEALSALPEDERESLYALRAVKITGLTDFYDKDDDGRREKLIVYIKPVDHDGDIIKAAGTVRVQLWNLNNAGDRALLGEWQVPPAELRKLWFDTLVSANYRLTFDAPMSVQTLAQPLTVQVTFTDCLRGETFTAQQLIKPRAN